MKLYCTFAILDIQNSSFLQIQHGFQIFQRNAVVRIPPVVSVSTTEGIAPVFYQAARACAATKVLRNFGSLCETTSTTCGRASPPRRVRDGFCGKFSKATRKGKHLTQNKLLEPRAQYATLWFRPPAMAGATGETRLIRPGQTRSPKLRPCTAGVAQTRRRIAILFRSSR